MKSVAAALLIVSACSAQEPNLRSWIMSPSRNAAVQNIAPDVHSIRSDDCFVYVESAGLSLHSFGALEANQYDPPLGPRRLSFRIPRHPHAGATHVSAPPGIIGVFATGVPIYNPIGTASWNDQNLWHYDAVASAATTATPLLTSLVTRSDRHSPIIGYALDGYPVYGPFGFGDDGNIRRMRSSYRLRKIARRGALPDGTVLTLGQEGPPVNIAYPLGRFAEDYEYVAGAGDLDEFNGRFAKTPEYPDGTYAYFLATADDGQPAWPYLIGPQYYGDPQLSRPLRVTVQRKESTDLWTDRAVLQTGEPASLTLVFHDAKGRPVRFLEKVHERPIHLIVVSKDLRQFAHIHPEPTAGDGFTVAHTFDRGGEYWIYADYTAPGEGPSIARFSVAVEGNGAARSPEADHGVRVAMTAPDRITAGRDVPLSVQLTNEANGQPLADLTPYLGAWAHIILISADGKNFIHAHPSEAAGQQHDHTMRAGPSPPVINVVTGFRDPGVYKLWLQFERRGEVITIPWTLNVRPAPLVTRANAPLSKNAIRVNVSSSGFEPARIEISAGKQTRLAFFRKDAQNCAQEVIFPELGIRKTLPAGETVVIDLPAGRPGEFHFACGMGMHRGLLLVKAN